MGRLIPSLGAVSPIAHDLVNDWVTSIKDALQIVSSPLAFSTDGSRASQSVLGIPLFMCRVCGSDQLVLPPSTGMTFRDVCEHVCQGKSKRERVVWDVELFVADAVANQAMQQMATANGGTLQSSDWFQCQDCSVVFMPAEGVCPVLFLHVNRSLYPMVYKVHHARRHTEFSIKRLNPGEAQVLLDGRPLPKGLVGKLAQSHILNELEAKEFICRHCEPTRPMSFNAMRSHVKSKCVFMLCTPALDPLTTHSIDIKSFSSATRTFSLLPKVRGQCPRWRLASVVTICTYRDP